MNNTQKLIPEYRFNEFKDLGEWQTVKLGDIGKIFMCKRILKEQTQPSGEIPFYKIGTFGKTPDAFITNTLFAEYKNKYPFPNKGDLLISASGTIGRIVAYNGELAYFQDSNIVWINNNNKLVLNKFLYFIYGIIKWRVESSTIPRLYNNIILNTKITIPTLKEQEKIADCLSSLDDIIESQINKLESLQDHKKGLLQNLVPTEKETIPRIRFPEFKNSEEWPTVKLGDIINIKSYSSKSKYIENTGIYSIIDMGAINSQGSILSHKKTNHDKDLLHKNDLVMVKDDIGKGYIIGKVCLIPYDNKFVCGDHVYKLSTQDLTQYCPLYLFYAINNDNTHKDIRRKANGTAQIGIRVDTVKTLQIKIPSIQEQEKIADCLSSLDQLIDSQTTKIQNLKQHKNALLQKLIPNNERD